MLSLKEKGVRFMLRVWLIYLFISVILSGNIVVTTSFEYKLVE